MKFTRQPEKKQKKIVCFMVATIALLVDYKLLKKFSIVEAENGKEWAGVSIEQY